jgi:heme/copper-type cytochrome/quinol oxidase subunit 3
MTAQALSPTTGEPVAVVARRNRLGVWLCIVSDVTGTVALLIAYTYLWSLNVNGAWAPAKNTFADPIPFWAIFAGIVVATLMMWWGARAVRAGNSGALVGASVVASLVVLVTFIGQIVQLSTFPFGPTDGAYASATFWLCLSASFHLSLVLFLTMAIITRTRKGLISQANPSHARFVAMFMTWVCVAIFLGALVATTMTVSPNVSSPPFGTFPG